MRAELAIKSSIKSVLNPLNSLTSLSNEWRRVGSSILEMVLKTYDTRDKPVIVTKPLTPKSFADFGDIISADHQIGLKEQSSANYGTAIKVHKVSKINNNSSKANSGVKAQANWNIFRCSPPLHLFQKNSNGETVYLSKVLERHPYSTQTFLPMGVDKEKDAYIVICAKSRAGE